MCASASPSVASVPEYLVTFPSASIAAMVSSEKRTRHSVSRYVWTNSRRLHPMANPATMAASKMPVPVADRILSLNSAASGFAPAGATGGTRWTTLCR